MYVDGENSLCIRNLHEFFS